MKAVRLLLAMSVITGLAYPLLVTSIAQGVFPRQANGSLIVADGKVIGSSLLGQPFDDPRYLWGRVSATSPSPYHAGASAASNLGPTNEALTKAARSRIDALRAADPDNLAPIPVDLVTSSASGLDPHVSPAAAYYQVPRIARARAVAEADVRAIVERCTTGRELGVLAEPRVNVLCVDLALDGR
ncbi:MAG: potassium-transporting ATPase subunit KdpC [Deltaproteobacteria bacterium]|nr:potassium-transporting ATPase subunit KdpC [Deltaproteobacteria bacterium]